MPAFDEFEMIGDSSDSFSNQDQNETSPKFRSAVVLTPSNKLEIKPTVSKFLDEDCSLPPTRIQK